MEAWIKRSMERQEVLEKLRNQTFVLEEKYGRSKVDYTLAEVLLNFLQDETTKQTDTPTSKFFFTEVLPAVSSFARAKEERNAMIANFLTFIIESITCGFLRDLQHREITEPEIIFHAKSATTET